MPARSPRVLVVTASMGAGHTEVANELARRLERAGAEARIDDMLELAGPAGDRLRATYRAILAHTPWLYDAAMRVWARHPAPLERLTAWQASPFEHGLQEAASTYQPDVIVSTFNLSSQCLGRLVRHGRITAPLITLVVDPGAHPYWVSPDVDLHLAPLARTATRLADFGARRVALAPPVVRPQFANAPQPARARARLNLPQDAAIVLVTAGSWAAGQVERSLDVLAQAPELHLVVLCGHDARLLRRLRERDGLRAVPWTAEVAGYVAAADVVVDNAGGLSCWEALTCGTPVVLFHPLPGHGRLNAAALEEAGLVDWAHTPRQLLDVTRRACLSHAQSPVHGCFAGPDAAAQVLSFVGDEVLRGEHDRAHA